MSRGLLNEKCKLKICIFHAKCSGEEFLKLSFRTPQQVRGKLREESPSKGLKASQGDPSLRSG